MGVAKQRLVLFLGAPVALAISLSCAVGVYVVLHRSFVVWDAQIKAQNYYAGDPLIFLLALLVLAAPVATGAFLCGCAAYPLGKLRDNIKALRLRRSGRSTPKRSDRSYSIRLLRVVLLGAVCAIVLGAVYQSNVVGVLWDGISLSVSDPEQNRSAVVSFVGWTVGFIFIGLPLLIGAGWVAWISFALGYGVVEYLSTIIDRARDAAL